MDARVVELAADDASRSKRRSPRPSRSRASRDQGRARRFERRGGEVCEERGAQASGCERSNARARAETFFLARRLWSRWTAATARRHADHSCGRGARGGGGMSNGDGGRSWRGRRARRRCARRAPSPNGDVTARCPGGTRSRPPATATCAGRKRGDAGRHALGGSRERVGREDRRRHRGARRSGVITAS